MPGVAFPPVGRLGLSSPPSPVLCAAKTVILAVSGHFPCRSRPDTLLASVMFVVSPKGRVVGSKPPDHARAFDRPVPHSGNVARRQVALPSSRATPVETCPALRPRWCPAYSPSRTQDCCLPATGNRRLSSRYGLERDPLAHNYTHFRAPSRGLPPRSLQLRTPIAGLARGVHYRLAG
jgi:hypothetical protein